MRGWSESELREEVGRGWDAVYAREGRAVPGQVGQEDEEEELGVGEGGGMDYAGECSREEVGRDALVSLACALGAPALSSILEEMSREPDCYFRGMPDLLFWRNRVGGGNDGTSSSSSSTKSTSSRSEVIQRSSSSKRSPAVTAGHRTVLPWMQAPIAGGGANDSIAGSQVNHNVFLVEVKSANDTLSKFQLAWIQLLQQVGITVEIAKVLNYE